LRAERLSVEKQKALADKIAQAQGWKDHADACAHKDVNGKVGFGPAHESQQGREELRAERLSVEKQKALALVINAKYPSHDIASVVGNAKYLSREEVQRRTKKLYEEVRELEAFRSALIDKQRKLNMEVRELKDKNLDLERENRKLKDQLAIWLAEQDSREARDRFKFRTFGI